MKDIAPFKIDKWVAEHGLQSDIVLHGSYASALSLKQLQQLSDGNGSPVNEDLQLTYGMTTGSVKLRQRIAELHSSPDSQLSAENVVITPGSIMANYLVLSILCGPGDHIICQYPTYGQLYILPRYAGAEVELWKMSEEQNWIPSTDDLAAMIRPNTRAIIVNNPSNPTGTVLSRETLIKIMQIAKARNITVMSDEVFSPLFHADAPSPPPFVSLGYSQSVSTGSVSKAHGLPGIRVGWVVSPNRDILQRVVTARDYTTISVSRLDDGVAAFALSPSVLPMLLERNLGICKASIALLDEFITSNTGRCTWVKPSGGGTAFICFLGPDGVPVDDASFVARIEERIGVSFIPGGHTFSDDGADDFRGYVRMAIGDDKTLRAGLERLHSFIRDPKSYST